MFELFEERAFDFLEGTRDRVRAGGAAWRTPHALDRDNTARPALPLPGAWHPTG